MLKTMSGRSARRRIGEVFVRLEADHVAEGRERGGDGVDGLCGVPFRVDVVVRRNGTGRVVAGTRLVASRAGDPSSYD